MAIDSLTRNFVRLPLYRQVEEAIRRKILPGKKAGELLPSEPELARLFAVSLVTIRQALAEIAKDGLIERRRGKGTTVTGNRSKEQHVAILIELDVSLEGCSPFYMKALQAIRRSLSAAGYASRPYLGFLPQIEVPAELTCTDLMEDARQGKIKAIVALHAREHPSWTEEAGRLGIPVIGWSTCFQNSIFYDREKAFDLALEHLHRRGRKRLAVIGWDNWEADRKPLSEVLERVAPKWGFPLEPNFLHLRAHGSEQGVGWQSLREIWISSKTKPDAFFITDETLFNSCVEAIRELKLNVPSGIDVALITGDWFNENVEFPVFKVGHQLKEVGEAVRNLIQALDQGEKISPMTLVACQELPRHIPDWMELQAEHETEQISKALLRPSGSLA